MKIIKLHMAGMALGLIWLAGCEDSKTARPTVSEKPGGAAPAPAGNEVAKLDAALVRIVNADPTNLSTSYKFQDRLISTHVPYMGISEFTPVEEGTGRLLLENEVAPKEVAATTQTFVKGNRYTIVRMTNSADKVELNVINDKMTPPAEGKAKVRFVVASPWLGEFTIASAAPGKKAFQSLEPHTTMDYADVDPYEGALELYGKSNRKLVGKVDGVKFEAGKLYTVIILGGRNNLPVEKLILVDKFV